MLIPVRDQRWSQTESSILIYFSSKSVLSTKKISCFASEQFIRVTFNGHFYETILWREVKPEIKVRILDNSLIRIRLEKTIHEMWDSLEADKNGFCKSKLRELREKAIENTRQQLKNETAQASNDKHNVRQLNIKESMKIEQAENDQKLREKQQICTDAVKCLEGKVNSANRKCSTTLINEKVILPIRTNSVITFKLTDVKADSQTDPSSPVMS